MGSARQLSFGEVAPSGYARRDPEKTLLHEVIRQHWQTFAARASDQGKELPLYVQKEFDAFLGCGVLAQGFVRLKCQDCRHEKLVAFSCKKRGFCPSCCGRRMTETGAFLSEEVFPREVGVRQWVLSVPIPLRYWMAANPALLGTVLSITTRAISGFYRSRAKAQGVSPVAETGAVTLIQRFGGSVNLNVHFHSLWMEGVFVDTPDTPRPSYRRLRGLTDSEVMELLSVIRKRVVRCLMQRGLLQNDESPVGEADELQEREPLLAAVMAASTQSRVAVGPRAGQRVRRMGSFGEPGEKPRLSGALCAELGGFSLHANVFIEPGRIEKLERLCRYVARPPVAESRLIRCENGDIGYGLKTPWSDGTYAVRFSPMEFIEKLVALIPQPRIHMTRYHGVLAPHHRMRSKIVPGPRPKEEGREGKPLSTSRRMTWAECLKRVFQIDLSVCPDCGGKVRFIAAVMKREVVVGILEHLGHSTAVPRWAPPQGPPQATLEF
jgi:hypothetical protein